MTSAASGTVVVPRQNEITVELGGPGFVVIREIDDALAAYGVPDAEQVVCIPLASVDAVVRALKNVKREARP